MIRIIRALEGQVEAKDGQIEALKGQLGAMEALSDLRALHDRAREGAETEKVDLRSQRDRAQAAEDQARSELQSEREASRQLQDRIAELEGRLEAAMAVGAAPDAELSAEMLASSLPGTPAEASVLSSPAAAGLSASGGRRARIVRTFKGQFERGPRHA